jgi:hypothetical protein
MSSTLLDYQGSVPSFACVICHVELERDGVRSDLPGRNLAPLEIAHPDQHKEAMGHKVLGDLKSDSLIGPGDQGDGFICALYVKVL